jgi:endonuclease/exonuclease/phosphatase family metal-dependent hydrolase
MQRNMLRVHLARILVVALTAIAGSVAFATAAQAASVPLTFFQFNMCGHSCNDGNLNVSNDVINSVNNRNPQPFVVTLNEVCRNQYNNIYFTLAPYYGRFETTVANGCGSGNDYGIAILLRTSNFSTVGVWNLPNPGGNELRKLVCLSTSATGGGTQPLVACVTHIDNHDANIAQQITFVANTTRPLWSGNHVMVGGDFNVGPSDSRLNPMYGPSYSPAGTGIFNEADAPSSLSRSGGSAGSSTNEYTGQCTSTPCGSNQLWLPRKKIDFIFLSRLDFTGYSADATYALRSDHTPLWATLTFV